MYPKPKRIVDPELIKRVREFDKCMLSGHGECWGGLDVHHIKSRGSGGDDLEDNLLLVCRWHHAMIHSGKINRDEQKKALKRFYYRLTNNPWS